MKTTPFIIAGTQRTGTTLVRTCLSSHPRIKCAGEVFLLGRHPYRDADGYWHYARGSLESRIRAFVTPKKSVNQYLNDFFAPSEDYQAAGIKLMLSHLSERPYIWSLLLATKPKVVLIRRNNVLKTLVSRRSAQQSGVYHVSKSLKKGTSVTEWRAPSIALPTATLIADLEAINAEHEAWKSRLEGSVDYIVVEYEDYVKNQKPQNERILDFIGAARLPVHSDLRKVNPDDLRTLIANYEQVEQTLAGTAFAACLDARSQALPQT